MYRDVCTFTGGLCSSPHPNLCTLPPCVPHQTKSWVAVVGGRLPWNVVIDNHYPIKGVGEDRALNNCTRKEIKSLESALKDTYSNVITYEIVVEFVCVWL